MAGLSSLTKRFGLRRSHGGLADSVFIFGVTAGAEWKSCTPGGESGAVGTAAVWHMSRDRHQRASENELKRKKSASGLGAAFILATNFLRNPRECTGNDIGAFGQSMKTQRIIFWQWPRGGYCSSKIGLV
jgi:hypothetical protein